MSTTKADPRRAALLIMDYQASILGGLPDTKEQLLATVATAINTARHGSAHVGYVRVAFDDSDFDAFPSHSAMGGRIKAAGQNMHTASAKTSVDPAIAPQEGDLVVRKTRVGAFSTTDLHERLSALGIETVVLAGVHTSGVVLSTVREAHDLDYRVIVLSDACGDPDPAVHAFLVEKIFPKQATVIRTEELAALFEA